MEIKVAPANEASGLRRRKRRLLIAGAAILILAAAAWRQGPVVARKAREVIHARLLSRFVLETVEWREIGASNLSAKVEPDLLWRASGLRKGRPLFETPLPAIEQRLRSSIPWIAEVRIQERLPSALSVQYRVHGARLVALRESRPWLVSGEGGWIAAVGVEDPDLPVVTGFDSMKEALAWLDSLERTLTPSVARIHELSATQPAGGAFRSIQALIEIVYAGAGADPARRKKGVILIEEYSGFSRDKALRRLRQVIQYLINNNILVSAIDLRAGQKIVVNVGKRL